MSAAEFGYPQIAAQAQQPLKDAAAVNATRYALLEQLQLTGDGLRAQITQGSGDLAVAIGGNQDDGQHRRVHCNACRAADGWGITGGSSKRPETSDASAADTTAAQANPSGMPGASTGSMFDRAALTKVSSRIS